MRYVCLVSVLPIVDSTQQTEFAEAEGSAGTEAEQYIAGHGDSNIATNKF